MQGLAADEPVYFVGLGSNLLVRDGGVRGTVVLAAQRAQPDHAWHGKAGAPAGVYAEAGVASPKVARFAALNDFEGAEFLAGIPGTVGGALAMNAGCYGGETWQYVTEVLTIDVSASCACARRRISTLATAMWRSRRGSGSEWFVAAWFAFKPGDGEASRQEDQGIAGKAHGEPADRHAQCRLGVPQSAG